MVLCRIAFENMERPFVDLEIWGRWAMIRLEDASFLVVGLARNCEELLEQNIIRIEDAFISAKRLHVLIVESDSADKSVEVLQRLASEKQTVGYVSLGHLSDRFPKRTERIAYCRNHYLELINQSPEYCNVDYVVVADMDGVNARLSSAAVKSCWFRTDWDACTASQAGPYYDIWALRHHLWSPNDCGQQARFFLSVGLSQFKSVASSIYIRMIRIPPQSEWIEVESAFGGLAIYRREILQAVRYVGLTADGEEVCEHVSLHEQIRSKGGRIFINPSLVNSSTVVHARYASSLGLVRFWIRCQLRDLAHRMKVMPHLKKARAFIMAALR
jgi:hypothetical protein